MAGPPRKTYREVAALAVVATVSCMLTSTASGALGSPELFTACKQHVFEPCACKRPVQALGTLTLSSMDQTCGSSALLQSQCSCIENHHHERLELEASIAEVAEYILQSLLKHFGCGVAERKGITSYQSESDICCLEDGRAAGRSCCRRACRCTAATAASNILQQAALTVPIEPSKLC